MELVIINFINGLSFASILFLLASGLSLVFGVMGVLNLAHGALYMMGAFIGLTVVKVGGGFIPAAFAAAIGFTTMFRIIRDWIIIHTMNKYFIRYVLPPMVLIRADSTYFPSTLQQGP